MAVWAPIAARTRVLMRMRSPLDWLPNRVIARSWASLPGVDGAADLRDPQLHAEVLEDGVGEGELVAGEGALRLADHHRVEPAIRVAQRREQPAGVGAALPGQRKGAVELPCLGGSDVLQARLPDPAVERERDHHRHLQPGPRWLPCVRGREPIMSMKASVRQRSDLSNAQRS